MNIQIGMRQKTQIMKASCSLIILTEIFYGIME